MSELATQLSDEEFIRQFENKTLPPKYFDHLGHIKIAWLYLAKNQQCVAKELVCNCIKKYAESLGATTKFNRTITDALVQIIAIRMANNAGQDWVTFINENTDIAEDAVAVLLTFYTPELLFSESARNSVIEPNIKQFN